MSIRAWLVRRQIRKMFRPPHLKDAPIAAKQEAIAAGMTGSETALPQPPSSTIIEKVDTEFGDMPVRGEWVYAPGTGTNRVVFYSHGGGYFWGGPPPYRDLAYRISRATGARIFLLDYSLTPHATCPTPIDEAVAAYKWVSREMPDAPITAAGDSAGGGLTAALMLALKQQGLALPASYALISPWLDLTASGESIQTNDASEVMLDPDAITIAAKMYAADLPLDDPRCSPLFGDLKGLPPGLVQVSDTEILLDDSTRFFARAEAAGSDVTLKIWPKMHHVWHMSAAVVPESKKAIQEMADFWDPHWKNTHERAAA